jgi:1-acyl-sn-glycerol-3-phosphate acyltransferase
VSGVAPQPVRRVLRWLVALLTRLVYRIDLRGVALPARGPALIVANHTAYVDPFVLVACGTYPVRFVYWSGLDQVPGVGRFCRFSGGIPIAGERQNPALYARAMSEIDAALANDEVVVVFPEGQLTRDGAVAPFKRGIETIARARSTPVVPTAIEGLWCSVFSRGPRRPRRLRPLVRVHVGSPIEAEHIHADALRDTVLQLLATPTVHASPAHASAMMVT